MSVIISMSSAVLFNPRE